MSKRLKQASKKAASQQRYISRAQAIKRLQLSISDFRKLCILKGVFPREPKHKRKLAGGSSADKSWYLTSDIQLLAQEPLVERLRTRHALTKHVTRYEGRNEPARIDALVKRAHDDAAWTLDHLIRERYPTFDSALEDLDDCLCMLALFRALPQVPIRGERDDKLVGLLGEHAQLPQRCQSLIDDFEAIVASTGTLTKAFISVKGFYFRAELAGHKLTWLVPHALATVVPADVDLKIMATFVDFYCTLLRHVNQRLRKVLSLDDDAVPPRKVNLLAGKTVFLSREVPQATFKFVVEAMGGKLARASEEENEQEDVEARPEIDIQVTDRPSLQRVYSERTYVQPQWLIDSLNEGELLEAGKYAPNTALPTHASPFAEEAAVDLPVDEEAQKLTGEQKELAKTMLTKRQRSVYERVQRSRQRTLHEQSVIADKKRKQQQQ